MKGDVLNNKFEETFKKVSETSQDFAPDVLLKFYALYKQATQENSFNYSQGEHELISAFKLNALLQVKHLSTEEAKIAYIETANQYLK